MIYKNRAKTTVLLFAILLLSSCASKRDFTKGVSEEDKRLLSSYEDMILFKYDDIRITKNGFYPDFKIPSQPKEVSQKFRKSKYSTNVASYINTKHFNLKTFMDDVNKYKLKDLRKKLLALKKKYPSVSLLSSNKKEMVIISSPNVSQNEIDKILVRNTPSYLNKITNPSKELQKIALKTRESRCTTYWNGKECLPNNRRPGYYAHHDDSSSSRSTDCYPGAGYSCENRYSGGSSREEYTPRRKTFSERYYRPGIGHVYDNGIHMGF